MGRLLCIVLILVLTAGPGAGCKPTQSGRELSLWHTFNPSETETLDSVLKDSSASLAGLRVRTTVVPFGRGQGDFAQAIAGEDCPDVFRAELPWVLEFVARGWLEPVDELLAQDGLAGALDPDALESVRVDGR